MNRNGVCGAALQDNGLKTVLTLSGVTSKSKLLSPENKIQPDYYVDSIADFFP